MKPDVNDLIVGNDYDITGWIRDRFGIDANQNWVGSKVSIHIDANGAARLHFEVLLTHDDLADLIARRKQ